MSFPIALRFARAARVEVFYEQSATSVVVARSNDIPDVYHNAKTPEFHLLKKSSYMNFDSPVTPASFDSKCTVRLNRRFADPDSLPYSIA
jgi:hypothetical protein